jgi:hypothetical protein
MSLPAIAGDTIYASDLYSICQPSGGSDVGESIIAGWASGASQTISTSTQTRSRVSTPVGFTLGTPSSVANLNTPQYGHMSSSVVQVYGLSSGAAGNCFAIQPWTINY